MKACVLHAVGDLRYEEVKDPVRKPHEVLIKIKASGICGSDIQRVFEKGTYSFPMIPGHEFGGEIIEAENEDLIGQRCTVFPLLPCQECVNCRTGHYAQCNDYDYFGSRCDGGFAELISVPLWNVLPAPDNVSFEILAMTEPCAVALHSLEQVDLKVGASVCVFGAGPIGIMLGKWALLKGASRVCLIDIDERKAAFADKLGFETELDGKYDIVIEGSGSVSGFESAVLAAKTFGSIVLMGNPIGEMKLSQNVYWKVLREELTLKGTWNSCYSINRNDWVTALKFIDKLDLSCLISHRYSFSRCNEAFSVIRERKEFSSKVMFIND